MPQLSWGDIYVSSDNGIAGNVATPVLVDNNGGRDRGWWNSVLFFAGANAHGQNRFYIGNGPLRSYSPTSPLSDEIMVGNSGWGSNNDGGFLGFVFCGVNRRGKNCIYAVTQEDLLGLGAGNLRSYSDTGDADNLQKHTVVGNGGWDKMARVFGGRDSKGTGCIFAVNGENELLLYYDDGSPGNVGNPVTIGSNATAWSDWLLFAGTNSAGRPRIYGVSYAGALASWAPTEPVSDYVIVGEPGVITPLPKFQPGWRGFGTLFTGVNSAGQNVIYGMYGETHLEQSLHA